VIGVALNGIQHPGDIAAAQAKLKTMADVKFRQIFDLLYGVNRSLDLFTQHGVDRIFECRILSVDKRFRGRGLARELLRRSVITARESGFKVVRHRIRFVLSESRLEGTCIGSFGIACTPTDHKKFPC
jgi:GNAT superfamily N-acetyltransferase